MLFWHEKCLKLLFANGKIGLLGFEFDIVDFYLNCSNPKCTQTVYCYAFLQQSCILHLNLLELNHCYQDTMTLHFYDLLSVT